MGKKKNRETWVKDGGNWVKRKLIVEHPGLSDECGQGLHYECFRKNQWTHGRCLCDCDHRSPFRPPLAATADGGSAEKGSGPGRYFSHYQEPIRWDGKDCEFKPARNRPVVKDGQVWTKGDQDDLDLPLFETGGKKHKLETTKPCQHDGTAVVFEIDGIRVRAAKVQKLDPKLAAEPTTLVLRCCWEQPGSKLLESWRERVIDWPNYKVPSKAIDREWWQKWWEREVKWAGLTTDLIVCCLGGHGRTGSALAAIQVVIGGKTAKEAIALVREKHCVEAIEGKEQEKYLATLEKQAVAA